MANHQSQRGAPVDNARSTGRVAGVGRHLRRNLVAYIAIVIAVAMTPIPSQAVGSLVGTSQIKNGAVTAKKIKNGAVKTTKVSDGAITAAKLGSGSVTAAKIGSGAVTARTLGTIVERVSATNSLANNSGGIASVTCAPGEKLISGGNGTVGVGTSSGFSVIRSQRGISDDTWEVVARNETGGSAGLVAIAYCLQ